MVKGQGHSVKTSSNRQIIAIFYETGVAAFNGDARILIGRQIAVCAQYNFGQKQRRTTSVTLGRRL